MQRVDDTHAATIRDFARLPRNDRYAIARHLRPVERAFLAELLNEKSRNTNRLISLKIEARLTDVSPKVRRRIRHLLLRAKSKCPPSTRAKLGDILGIAKNDDATTLAASNATGERSKPK